MKRIFSIGISVLLFFLSLPVFAGGANTVYVLDFNGAITPMAEGFISEGLHKAESLDAYLFILCLDTPGGLDSSMRDIIKAFNRSSIPVVVYVSPSGARAASAGVFITMAASVAAMAPGTNIGAAHPVSSSGGTLDKTMGEKVTNDSVAFLKAIARRHDRNDKWPEEAVRKSASLTAEEALREKVIDIIAADLDDLLKQLNDRETTVGEKKVRLATRDVRIIREGMGIRQKILGIISDPNVAYILMLIGFYGLYFELSTPGAILPGVLGGLCLVLALYSFSTLPVSYAGVLLIILGIVMFVLEAHVVSFGLLTMGGAISMAIGSLMLFGSSDPTMRLSLSVIIPAILVTAIFFGMTVNLAVRAYRRRPQTGIEAMVGMKGTARTDISDKGGSVFIDGAIWQAYTELGTIEQGTDIVVQEVNGLKLRVIGGSRGKAEPPPC